MNNNEMLSEKHTSNRYNKELEEIRSRVLDMGTMVEEQLEKSLRSLLEIDSALGEEVVESEHKINAIEIEIDQRCIEVLARRQPAASDLRLIIAVTKTIADLERIGDQAERLAKFALKLSDEAIVSRQFSELRHMSHLVQEMLSNTLDAFVRTDVKRALELLQMDKEIDEKLESITRQLITYMMEDPRQIKSMMRISWCARSLERIGDHACNICEYIVFLVEGKDIRHTSDLEKEKMLDITD